MKRGLKLRELVLQGTTSLRLKGRSIRIRTPLCRALKKFNQPLERGSGATERLPCSVSVSLSAGSMTAWTRVQGYAHNPRVRVLAPLDRSVASLLRHLEAKWRPQAFKMRDHLSTRHHLLLHPPPVVLPHLVEPSIRLRPSMESHITLSRIRQVGPGSYLDIYTADTEVLPGRILSRVHNKFNSGLFITVYLAPVFRPAPGINIFNGR